MATNLPNGRLDSWKAIAAYLDRDVSTVIRWEKEKGLPVHRVPGGKRQVIFALPAEIDAWLVGQPGESLAAGRAPAARRWLGPARWVALGVLGASVLTIVAAWMRGTPAAGSDVGADPSVLEFARHDIDLAAPYSLATTDLDGDGHLDLVVTAYDTSLLHSLLGRGDGTFQPAAVTGIGISPDGVVLADFNRDGHVDAATGNRGSNSVSVLHGTGDGRFEKRVDYPAGQAPRGLAALDVDADGAVDLAVANYGGGSVTILHGPASAGREPTAYDVGSNPFQVGAADLNGDDLVDLVVTNTNEESAAPPDHPARATLTILVGIGQGAFRELRRYSLGDGPSGVAIADLDQDGHLDLAVTGYTRQSCYVLRGRGDGTFEGPVTLVTGGEPVDVGAADLDDDGVLDLVTTNAKDRTLSILRGRGDGTFEPKRDVAVHRYPKAIVFGDMNEDGLVDMVVSNYHDNTISVLINATARRLSP